VCNLSRRDAKVVLECMLGAMIQALQKGDTVYIRRFGTFNTRVRPPRPSRNPITGAHVTSPAKKVARFKASKELLRLVAGVIEELGPELAHRRPSPSAIGGGSTHLTHQSEFGAAEFAIS